MRILFALASAVVVASTAAAFSADPYAPPPSLPVVVQEVGNGWYLRGDVGFVDYMTPKEETSQGKVGSRLVDFKLRETVSVGGGVGYRLNEIIRVDATADFRRYSDFSNRSSRTNFAEGFNKEQGDFGAVVTLANVYADLGTWHGVTPYVGAGVGLAWHGFRDYFSETTCTTVTCGNPSVIHTIGLQGDKVTRPDRTDTRLAWALMGGLSIDLGQGLSLDTGYRYLNMGKGRSGRDEFGFDTRLKDIQSHEVRVGLRWAFSGLQSR